MIPIRIKAVGYATYPTLEWTIPEGLTSVIGRNTLGEGIDSNGAGKTKLLETIPLALFGPSLPWSEYLAAGAEECSVELEFEHGGERYRVRRTYSAKGRGKTTLDFEALRSAVGDWRPETLESQSETQALIARTIGLSEATFAHSVFAAQGARHFADPSLPPRERKQILSEALGLGVWDRLLELVRADVRAAEEERAVLVARLGEYEVDMGAEPELRRQLHDAQLAAHAAGVALVAAEVAEAEKSKALVEVEQAARDRAALKAALAARQEQLAGLAAQLQAAEQAGQAAVALRAELAALADRLVPLEALEVQLRQGEALAASFEAVRSQRAQGLAQAEGLRREAKANHDTARAYVLKRTETTAQHDHLKRDGAGTCRECGQPLQGEALAAALAVLAGEIQLLGEQAQGYIDAGDGKMREAAELEGALPVEQVGPLPNLEPLRGDVADARQAQLALAGGEERLAGLERDAAAVQSAEFQQAHAAARSAFAVAEDEFAGAEPVSEERLEELRREAGHAAAAVRDAREAAGVAAAELARCEERLNQLVSLAERHAEALRARDRLSVSLGELAALEGAYGRNGIPALILESAAIPQIEAEAQRVLGELGVPFRVELVTQRETKTGTLKDTLDVIVHEPGGPRRYETYSGGEQTRLEFALQIALARLVASHRGAQAGILCLDELAFLDSTGMAAVANVLKGLTEFRSVLLVSHDDRLMDAFDQQVLVVRDEDGSRLEEVAA